MGVRVLVVGEPEPDLLELLESWGFEAEWAGHLDPAEPSGQPGWDLVLVTAGSGEHEGASSLLHRRGQDDTPLVVVGPDTAPAAGTVAVADLGSLGRFLAALGTRRGDGGERPGGRFRLLAETSLAGVYIVEGDLFVYVNPAFAGFLGYEPAEIMGRLGPRDLIWPEDWPTARENLRKRFSGEVSEVRYELRLIHRDGHPVRTLAWGRRVVSGDRVYIMGTLLDITREREAMEGLVRQERMAAVGRLAAGIAHDFNNILQAISLNADLLAGSEGLPETARRRLETIRKQVAKGSGIVRQVLDYARVSETHPAAVELGSLVRETLRLLTVTIRENITVRTVLAPGEHWVLADPVKLDQVVSNLVINAADAMPEGGELTVSLRSLAGTDGAPTPGPGLWRVLSVRDTGVGMDEATRRRIFEPFFTTKGPTKGTGLGLAQVWGILERYGGTIEVSSEPGRGSEFTVYLPAAQGEDGTEAAAGGEAPPVRKGWGAGRRVLLAEDDAEVRRAAAEGLRTVGFEVLEAADGAAALDLLERSGGEPALVVTDMVMPRLGGEELVRRLRERGYGGPVLFITGYPQDAGRDEAPEPPGGDWLRKPFTVQELGAAVARLLRG